MGCSCTDDEWKGKVYEIVTRLIQENVQTLDKNDISKMLHGTLFLEALTTPAFDKKFNYEYLEHMGDSIFNTFIVWYFYTNHPNLMNMEGVHVVSKARSKYSSYEYISSIGESLGFRNIIRKLPTEEISASLLEDCTEAFIGALVLSSFYYFKDMGKAYSTGYEFLSSIYNKRDDNCDLSIKSLTDSITRLKEWNDKYYKNGSSYSVTYEMNANRSQQERFAATIHVRLPFSGEEFKVSASGNRKSVANKLASAKAIQYIDSRSING